MKTSVVIPNWRGRKLLEKNLPKILAAGFDEAIVVDDASPDDSVAFLEKNYPQARLLKNEKNLGFPASVNRGVAAATSDIVFLFNVDVAPHGNIISPVLRHFKNPKVFGVSLAEQKFSWTRPLIRNSFLQFEDGPWTKVAHRTFWISGGSGAFRKSMWVEIGGMDTLFSPFYWEDIDLSFRALKRGWELVWETKARVTHQHETIINPRNFSKKKLDLIKERNEVLFNWKHLATGFLLTRHILGILWRLRHPGYFLVLFWAVAKLPQIIWRRIIEKRQAPLSNEEVLAQFEKES